MKLFKSKKKKPEEPRRKLAKKGEKERKQSSEETTEIVNGSNDATGKLQKKERIKVKKEKEEKYILKKNTGMKIIRVIFWIILIFIFARGVYQIVKPDKVSEITSIISNFKKEQENIGDHPDEVMKFAQDFAKEYLTYSQSGEADFKRRIAPYVSKRVNNIAGIYGFRNTARANYVNAYRKETVSSSQYNVFVNAEIQYDMKNTETGEITSVIDKSTLKIPVMASEIGYCIVSLPMFVVDARQDLALNPQEMSPGSEIDKNIVEGAVINFLEAYYSQDQRMINYLLTADAEKDKFIGLTKRYTYQQLESLRAYMPENEIICLLKVRVQDAVNQETIYQEFSIRLVQNEDKYYVRDMDSNITE